jgi:hypothetical protein
MRMLWCNRMRRLHHNIRLLLELRRSLRNTMGLTYILIGFIAFALDQILIRLERRGV